MSVIHKNLAISCFGEVLFDVFPTYQKIGGAPLNVAIRLSSLNVKSTIISSVGNDKNGQEIINFARENKVETHCIQINNNFDTGVVAVELDENGNASYSIKSPVAWDKIESTIEAENAVKNTDALIFGSLTCRDWISINTLTSLIKFSRFKVFDVNLRPPFFSKNCLIELMNVANFIKFNDDELLEICKMMQSPFTDIENNIVFIAKKTNTNQICITRGGLGAVLYFGEKMYYNQGYKVIVKDTVGSGDSFLAGLIAQLLSKNDPQVALDFACGLGAMVATHEGANPEIMIEEITQFINNQT